MLLLFFIMIWLLPTEVSSLSLSLFLINSLTLLTLTLLLIDLALSLLLPVIFICGKRWAMSSFWVCLIRRLFRIYKVTGVLFITGYSCGIWYIETILFLAVLRIGAPDEVSLETIALYYYSGMWSPLSKLSVVFKNSICYKIYI
jgi:hypothetical protein